MNPTSAQERCTESDYRQLFSSSSDELYELCLVLTADEALATASFAAARERTVKDATKVFREWMWTWARRQIVKACIATSRPEIESDLLAVGRPQNSVLNVISKRGGYDQVVLDALVRFTFVLRKCEGYSARETALLLDISPMILESAYQRAVRALGPERLCLESSMMADCSRPRNWARATTSV
jgi:DNA-directed RNA polymerase specialized sigma24 family protein